MLLLLGILKAHMTPAITTTNLTKAFRVHVKEPGLVGSLKSLVRRQYKTVQAVKKVNISIKEGELVGFIGPNGAGKTTTLKMLSGLLYPSSGTASVMGFTPWQRKKDFLKRFSLVMGQKHQLWWDLPLYDSLLLQRDIYDVPPSEFERNLRELTNLLDLDNFLKVQVRKLSLGQRMRGELAAAFIYNPRVLFLDEPTIGLDIVVQKKVRDFIAAYQQQRHATIILTSHYLDDVRELCERLIVIDHGVVAFDGTTDELIHKHVDHKQITLTFASAVAKDKLATYGKVVEYHPLRASLQVARDQTTERAAALLTSLPVADISIEEPTLQTVVRELFTREDYA